MAAAFLAVCGLVGAANAQRPTLSTAPPPAPAVRSFPTDLARNFAGLWSGDNLMPLIVGTSATAAAIPADGSITDYFRDDARWPGFDPVGRKFGKSQILGPIIGGAFVASRFTKDEGFRRLTYALGQGFVMTNALTAGIKLAGQRERPDQASHYSFPSGHTSNSFLWATVVSRTYGWKKGAPAYAFAAYVGASRLKSRKHYLSDVVAGAALGYIVGRTVTRNHHKDAERRVRWGVEVPAGGGMALNIGIRP